MKQAGFPSPSVLALLIILILESVGALLLTGLLFFELRSTTPDTYSTAIALVVVVAIGALWILATTLGFIRRKPFAKGSALVWNILQAAIGVISNQGDFARPDIGSALLLPALTAIALLLFAKPVSEYVSKPPSG